MTVGSHIAGDETGIKVFPVPGKGMLYAECSGEWVGQDLTFQVFDATGKNVWSTLRSAVNGRETFNLRHLPAGSYQLVVKGAGKTAQFSIIIVE